MHSNGTDLSPRQKHLTVFVGATPCLQDSTGVKARLANPDPGKGAVGGYYLVDTENLEQALEWAAHCRFITGTNWVYPLWE